MLDSFQPTPVRTQIHVPRQHGTRGPKSGRQRRSVQDVTAPGRTSGRAAGGWMSDLAALKQTILLCDSCVHRFDPKPVHYYREGRFQAIGGCDGCVQHYGNVFLFVHESYLGSSWEPGK